MTLRRRALRAGAWLGLICSAVVGRAAAQLGSLEFPNSGSAAAQPAFLRGVLLLHSFEYERAAQAFREAQRIDPGFALAYWGEALTHTHPIWNQQDVPAARAALGRLGATPAARAAKAPTERERGYLAAIEVLYGDGPKERRDTLYQRELERLAAKHPEDLEARAFDALARMGLSQGTRNVPTYVRAGAIALDVLRANPEHPGAAHYVIHAFDDPVHAPLGLPAARAYSRIAPDAPHAQHMTTHIFLALGMWADVVAQNTVAAGPDSARWRPGHYTSWLAYGLLQQGRVREAAALLDRVTRQLPANAPVPPRAYLLAMRAHHRVNAGDDEPASPATSVDASGVGVVARAMDLFGRGYRAAGRGDRAEVDRAAEAVERIQGERNVSDFYGGQPTVLRILALELRALGERLDGRLDAAIATLREASEIEAGLPVEFGPPDVVKPSFELLGETLLAADRPAQAVDAFQRALAMQPGRSAALIGLVEAARRAGDAVLAERTRALLASNYAGADPDVRARAMTLSGLP
ncbi:MAG: hypothetical protein AB7R55_04530 [Gemmatimonadales bacterium]